MPSNPDPRAAPAPTWVTALLLALAPAAFALSTDRDQPINIEADRAEADERQRVTIYRGDAVIVQGTLRITGETIWIYLNENDEFVKLVSVGEPASMRQLPDGATDFRNAEAERLEYFAEKDLIVMLGDAVYGQGDDVIRADRIEYDSLKGRMKARAAPAGKGSGEPKGRVNITITPKKKQGE